MAAVLDDLAGADVLSDAAALPGRDLGCSDRIEERRLAVVDVAHDRDDRGARLKEARVVLLIELLFRGGAYRSRLTLRTVARGRAPARLRGLRDLVAELLGNECRGLAIDALVYVGEDAALDQFADHVGGVDAEQIGEVLDRDARRQLDRAAVARVGSENCASLDSDVAAHRLARSTSAPRAAPTLGHDYLLMRSCSPPLSARPGVRPGSALPALAGAILCRAPRTGTPPCRRHTLRGPASYQSGRPRFAHPACARSAAAHASAAPSDRRRKTGSETAAAARPGLRRHLAVHGLSRLGCFAPLGLCRRFGRGNGRWFRLGLV